MKQIQGVTMQTTLKHQISKVTIVDRPCGTGKTSRLLKSFEQDKKYIVVVPLLSEVKRFIDSANVLFEEPIDEYLFNKTSLLSEYYLLQLKKAYFLCCSSTR